jgi:hypothetical protein
MMFKQGIGIYRAIGLHMGVVKTLLCNAVGCPDDCGEQLLATENSQPVTTPFNR